MACPLHDAWKRICREYLGSLENTTLQDIADFKRKVELAPDGTLKIEAIEVPESAPPTLPG
jgi:DNA-binding IscR family transcriptional regulator